MFKVLFKKELLQYLSIYSLNKKKNAKRKPAAILGIILLWALIFFSCGFAFFGMGKLFIQFADMGLSWFYFAFFAILSFFVGTFLSMFQVSSHVFNGKDNLMLLSLPVKPSIILINRLIGVYLIGVLFSSIVYIPALIVYYIDVKCTLIQIIYQILFLFILGLIILAFGSLFGFIVAFVSSKLKNKTIVTVLISFLLLALYYFVYFKINTYLQLVVKNVDKYSKKLSASFIIYNIGKSLDGNLISMLIVIAFAILIFLITFAVLNLNFTKIVMSNKGQKQVKYVEKTVKVNSIDKALLGKEAKHFFSSAPYILNIGLGVVISVALSVFALIKADTIKSTIVPFAKAFGLFDYIPVAVAGVIGLLVTMNNFTAPSISLEGKSRWILQTSPIDSKSIMNAKLKFHMLINYLPILALSLSLTYIFGLEPTSLVFILIYAVAFAQFTGNLGLYFDLNKPNFDWTNETVPIKQGLPVCICLFGGWFLSIATVGVSYLVKHYLLTDINLSSYILVIAIILILASRFINKSVMDKSTETFNKL